MRNPSRKPARRGSGRVCAIPGGCRPNGHKVPSVRPIDDRNGSPALTSAPAGMRAPRKLSLVQPQWWCGFLALGWGVGEKGKVVTEVLDCGFDSIHAWNTFRAAVGLDIYI